MLVPNGVCCRGVPLSMGSESAYMLTESLHQYIASSNIATENTNTQYAYCIIHEKDYCIIHEKDYHLPLYSVIAYNGLAYICTLGNKGTGVVCTQVSTNHIQPS